MKKIFLCFCLSLLVFLSNTYAGGGMTHMFIAKLAIEKLPTQLRNLLLNNLDAYLVGAYYPDSGYIEGLNYGESSHWDPFIFNFADYIKETYQDPAIENPRLVAFLFGCATHRVSDEVIHFIFYKKMREKDFHGNDINTHQYGDVGIDLMLNIDKDQWSSYPKTWWIPVNHLVNVYQRMGLRVTSDQITTGTSIIQYAGFGERAISAPSYPYLKWRMPWTAAHYMDSPDGGINADTNLVAKYQIALWQRLTNKSKKNFSYEVTKQNLNYHQPNLILYRFAYDVITSGAVKIPITQNADGSVELGQPFVAQASKLQTYVKKLIATLTKW